MPISAVDLSKPANQQSVPLSSSRGNSNPASAINGVHISAVNLSGNNNSAGSAFIAKPSAAPSPTSTAAAPQQQPSFMQRVEGTAEAGGNAVLSAGNMFSNAIHAVTAPVGEAINNTIQNTPVLKNTFDSLIAAKNTVMAGRDAVNNAATEAFAHPFGAPAQANAELQPGYDPEQTAKAEAKYGVTDQKTLAQQQDVYNNSMLAAQNHVFGEAGASMIKGATAHIINPQVDKPQNAMDSVIDGTFEAAGQLYAMHNIGEGVGSIVGNPAVLGANGEVVQEGTGLLGKSGMVAEISQKFPTLGRFIPAALKNVSTFNIYSQLNPEKQNRLHAFLTDSVTAMGQSALAGTQLKVAIPASFLLGAGMTKLDGGSNKQAFGNGLFMVALDLTGRLGKTKALLDVNGADPILKEQAINKLNEFLEEPLPKTATYEDAVAARREMIKNGTYVNPSSPDAKPEDIQRATQINTAIDMLKPKMGIVAPEPTQTPEQSQSEEKTVENQTTHVMSPEDLKTQIQTTDLKGTPAEERLSTIGALAEQTGKDVQVDLTGKTGVPVATPGGNQIGVTLVEKGTQANAVSQESTTQNKPETTPKGEGATLAVETQKTPPSTNQRVQGTTPVVESQQPTKVTQNDLQQSAQRLQEGGMQPTTDQIPHKENYSRLQERLEEQLIKTNGERYNWDETNRTYNKVSLQEDAQKTVDFLQQDPQRALRIAQGYETPKSGDPLEFSIANAVALKAFDEGNAALGTKIMNRLSQTATRYGQNIVSLRGNFNDNTPQNFMRQVIAARMDALGRNTVTEANKLVGRERSAKTRAVEHIDREVEKLSKQMRAERNKIKMAQDVIDSLICK